MSWLDRNAEFVELFDVMDLGALISHARESAQLTQFHLAERLACSQSMISRLEANKKQPTIRTLARVAAETGVELRVSMFDRASCFDGAGYFERRRELRRAESLAREAARIRNHYRR